MVEMIVMMVVVVVGMEMMVVAVDMMINIPNTMTYSSALAHHPSYVRMIKETGNKIEGILILPPALV